MEHLEHSRLQMARIAFLISPLFLANNQYVLIYLEYQKNNIGKVGLRVLHQIPPVDTKMHRPAQIDTLHNVAGVLYRHREHRSPLVDTLAQLRPLLKTGQEVRVFRSSSRRRCTSFLSCSSSINGSWLCSRLPKSCKLDSLLSCLLPLIWWTSSPGSRHLPRL